MIGFLRLILMCSIFLVVLALPGRAQNPPPTIVEFWTKADTLFLEISLNAEMFLAGIDPDAETELSSNARYRTLRQLVSTELEAEMRAFTTDWAPTLQVEVGGPVSLSYEGIRIPVVGDPDQPRVSKLLLAAPLSGDASNLRLTWPAGYGSVVLKQQRVAAPYTGYLTAGEISPLIPLRGGASLSAQQALQEFFPLGIFQIVPAGLREIVLVLCLVFLSLGLRPMVAQMLLLSIGTVFGLALSVYGALALPPILLSQSLTAAIIVLALWNLILRRLHVLRLLAVFGVGLLLGAGLSEALAGIGVPPDHLPAAMLGYSGGVLAVLYAVAAAGYAIAHLISGGSERMQGRVCVLASILIAGAGVYWMIVPWTFS